MLREQVRPVELVWVSAHNLPLLAPYLKWKRERRVAPGENVEQALTTLLIEALEVIGASQHRDFTEYAPLLRDRRQTIVARTLLLKRHVFVDWGKITV